MLAIYDFNGIVKMYNIQFRMASQQQAIGMMEGAFFVPKGDLINWVNSLLALEVIKIEQLGTGAVYCQIVDAMFPGKVPMQRVNWSAKNQWQFISNYKILQQAFAKCKIQKYIDIEKLAKSKYQDNLQFIQWMKRYYDLFNKNTQGNYDPVSARKNAHIDFSFVEFRNHAKRKDRDREKEKEREDKMEVSINKRAASKSPYDRVKAKINYRSATIAKPDSRNKKTDLYIEKLCKIRDILKKSPGKGKSEDPINKIRQIVQQIEEDLPQEVHPSSKLETSPSPSHSVLDQVFKKDRNKDKVKEKERQRYKDREREYEDRDRDRDRGDKKQSEKNIKKSKK